MPWQLYMMGRIGFSRLGKSSRGALKEKSLSIPLVHPIAHLGNQELLQTLYDSQTRSPRLIALSARDKQLHWTGQLSAECLLRFVRDLFGHLYIPFKGAFIQGKNNALGRFKETVEMIYFGFP